MRPTVIRLIVGGALGIAFSISLMLPGALVLPEEHPMRHLAIPDVPSTMVVRAAPVAAPKRAPAPARRRVVVRPVSRTDGPHSSGRERGSPCAQPLQAVPEAGHAHEPACPAASHSAVGAAGRAREQANEAEEGEEAEEGRRDAAGEEGEGPRRRGARPRTRTRRRGRRGWRRRRRRRAGRRQRRRLGSRGRGVECSREGLARSRWP